MKPKTPAQFAQAVGTSVERTRTKQLNTPSGRFYQVDDETYPSVTHILSCIGKPALINWAANTERTLVSEASADLYEDLVRLPTPLPRTTYLTTLQTRLTKAKAHQKELAKAGEIGSQAHGLIEWKLRAQLSQTIGPEPRVNDAATWAVMAFEDWAKSVSLKPLFIEQMVYSRTHGFAGTMDLLAEVNGVVTLVDFKTGKAIYDEALLQNVAYQVAMIEMGHAAPAAGLIVRLPKIDTDPEFETKAVPPVDTLFPIFLAVKKLWQWTYANDQAWRDRQAAKNGPEAA